MSFWDLSDGKTAVDTPKDYEILDGMKPIPNNSDVLAIVDQAKWAEKDGAAFVELRWSVMAPEEVKNRKVFHKVWVTDLEPQTVQKKGEAKAKEKRDKARRMLASIDANAGGNLTRTGDAPTDETLTMHLCNVPMVIKVMVWSMKGSDGTDMAGNWVSAVSPSDKPLQISSEPLPKTSAAPAPYQGGNSDIDGDSIPF
tara:strand:+ start:196 stop:789 length:594 start_codon:yes stop_codon:yes gene_type:complete